MARSPKRAGIGVAALVGRQRAPYTYPHESRYRKSAREAFLAPLDNLLKLIDSIEGATIETVYEALVPTFQKSQYYCPYKTGRLRNSGFLEISKRAKGPGRVVIGYGRGGNPHYAALVHEKIVKRKPPTRSKFLQSALEEDANAIQQRIIEGVRAIAEGRPIPKFTFTAPPTPPEVAKKGRSYSYKPGTEMGKRGTRKRFESDMARKNRSGRRFSRPRVRWSIKPTRNK